MKSITVQSKNSPFVDSVTESRLNKILCAKSHETQQEPRGTAPAKRGALPLWHKTAGKEILNLTSDGRTHKLAKLGS